MVKNKDAYISLRESLDSFSEMALAEFASIEVVNEDEPAKSVQETEAYSQFVLDHVRTFRNANAARQRDVWTRVSKSFAERFQEHALALSKVSGKEICGPGFRQDANGRCVRIRG